MRKKEVLKKGKWPIEFLEGLVSQEPSITVPSDTKLIWRCVKHGDYTQRVSDHLRNSKCPKCSKEEAVLIRQKDRLSNITYSEQFLKDIENSPDKERILNGDLRRKDKATFICKIHGVYSQSIAHHMSGQGCPRCGDLRSAEKKSGLMRTKSPYPQWFVDDLEGSPDKDKVLSGELKSHDKAYFVCKDHGLYHQLIYDPLYGRGCPTCASNFTSNREKVVYQYLISEGIRVIKNDRNLLSDSGNYELDLYLPDHKVAFEFNGYLYHCSGSKTEYGYGGKSKYYHRDKTEACLSKGVRLYHIWEDCSDILCISLVKAKLGLCDRVYARKCDVVKLKRDEEKSFFSLNHVAGYTQSSRCFALKLNGEVKCALSLRRNFNHEYEIARFATQVNIEVVGGYSRLLSCVKRFLIENGITKLVSYCDRDLSPDRNNNFYANHGFKFVSESSLIMKYYSLRSTEVNGRHYKTHQIVDRFSLRKQILVKELGDKYKEGMTEQECAELLGFRPVYNSGNFKYRIHL